MIQELIYVNLRWVLLHQSVFCNGFVIVFFLISLSFLGCSLEPRIWIFTLVLLSWLSLMIDRIRHRWSNLIVFIIIFDIPNSSRALDSHRLGIDDGTLFHGLNTSFMTLKWIDWFPALVTKLSLLSLSTEASFHQASEFLFLCVGLGSHGVWLLQRLGFQSSITLGITEGIVNTELFVLESCCSILECWCCIWRKLWLPVCHPVRTSLTQFGKLDSTLSYNWFFEPYRLPLLLKWLCERSTLRFLTGLQATLNPCHRFELALEDSWFNLSLHYSYLLNILS